MKIKTLFAFDVKLPTPHEGIDLAGFLPVRQWEGKGGGLMASFLVIITTTGHRIVLGSLDTLFLDQTFEAELKQRMDEDISLILVASHTHYAPNLARSVSTLGRVNDQWYTDVLDVIAKSLNHPDKSNCLETVAWSGFETNLSINRRLETWFLDYSQLKRGRFKLSKGISLAPNPTGCVDPNVRIAQFKNSDGKAGLFLWSFAAHPVCEDSNKAISAEFPGAVREAIKQSFGPDCISIYLPGLAGSSLPRCKAKTFAKLTWKERLFRLLPFQRMIPPVDPDDYERWKSKLATVVMGDHTAQDELSVTDLPVIFDTATAQSVFIKDSHKDLSVEFRSITLGDDLVIVVGNGELLTEWHKPFSAILKDTAFFMVSGYGAGDCFYVPPDTEISRGGYEVHRFKGAFGLSGEFSHSINEKMTHALRTAIHQTKDR